MKTREIAFRAPGIDFGMTNNIASKYSFPESQAVQDRARLAQMSGDVVSASGIHAEP